MWFIKFLLLVFVLYFVSESDAMNADKEGVCVVKLSSRDSRRKTFSVRINKMCGRRKCVARRSKVEYYTKWENHTVCCNGWKHDSDLDICVPVCTGCDNGRCIAPETCFCEPPLYQDPSRVKGCIPYECNPPCFGAQCWPNNTCKCLPDLQKYNATHCAHCDEGYTINQDLKCTPKCDQTCVNATCVAPNTCRCLEGYRSKDNYTCEPICDCVNAVCVAPKTCSCIPGYTAVNASFCSPVCDNCDNGDCTGPQNCICHDGFEMGDGACKPVCSTACVNGVCSAPDVCECTEGYTRNASKPEECFKPCSEPCDGVCDLHGVCHKRMCNFMVTKSRWINKKFSTWSECKRKPPCWVKRIQRYKEPVLKCCTGFEYVNAKDTCEPICSLGCINGSCISPNNCRCEPPLLWRKGACVQPVCEPACGPNSTCTDTNICTCDKGFLIFNSTHCAPRCLPGYFNDPIDCKPRCSKCVNGTCTAPEVCGCKEGYTKIDNHTCSPACNPSCENATCTDPNVCSCLEGFYRINESKCAPICVNCSNGDCVAPGDCRCHEGYEKRNGVCEPVCESPCVNGTCVDPNVCQCNIGYELDTHNTFNCLPICEPKCVNASCVSPNTCSCLTGYETTGNNWTCKPRCEECDNGDCIEPNICRCHPGYENFNGTCQPKCSKPCQNGICSKPEVCSCMKHYKLSSEDRYTCVPICEPNCVNGSCMAPGVCECLPNYDSTKAKHVCTPHCDRCVNGECVAPGVCRCYDGYNGTQGVCSPVCSTACVNSNCTLPDICTCVEGYTKNLTTPNVCYKECAGPCDHGACDLHGNCLCDLGYELQNDTCISNPVDCNTCDSNCTSDEDCRCASGQPCFWPAEVASSTNLAGLELTWMMGAAVGFLLIVLLLVVIVRIGKNKHHQENKEPDDLPKGSVVQTVANTLLLRRPSDIDEEGQERYYEELALDTRREDKDTSSRLLEGHSDDPL